METKILGEIPMRKNCKRCSNGTYDMKTKEVFIGKPRNFHWEELFYYFNDCPYKLGELVLRHSKKIPLPVLGFTARYVKKEDPNAVCLYEGLFKYLETPTDKETFKKIKALMA